MSTGLMSCVRENSPPLEGVSIPHDDGDARLSHSPDPFETQKRRRFHPLRNLRRIFRRRTVPRGDFAGQSGDNCSSIPSGGTSQVVNSSDSSSPPSIVDVTSAGSVISGGYTTTIYLTKERLESNSENRSGKKKDSIPEMERDIGDYQRSFSEGLLLDDGGYSRDALSQSHDSVFSESATASSLSIVLKAELVDVLRKRRNRPNASDENVGLPRSPITPQRKDRPLNHSEGSLSLLSMVSSNMEPEQYPMLNGNNVGPKLQKRSIDIYEASAEHDLNLSVGSKLSHSAARHKMAVRPNKKKGPTRHRKAVELKNPILPVTLELNEDTAKMRDVVDKKARSKSLPPGVNAKILEHATVDCLQSSMNILTSSTESSSSTIYINPQLSKSYAFENKLESVERQEGFLQLRKKSTSGSVENVDNDDASEICRVVDKKVRPMRCGAAARQRILPKDLSYSPDIGRNDKMSNEKFFVKTISGFSAKCRETVTPIRSDEQADAAVAPPPNVVWPDGVVQSSPTRAKISGEVVKTDTPRRKSVEKSKSFRFYSENNESDNLTQNNLPSLPDLSIAAYDEKYGTSVRRSSLKYSPSMKFEINDNNLVKPKEELHHPFESNPCGKNIILPPNKMSNPTNISQIEENIDKLVKSTFVTVLKKSPSNGTEWVEAKIRHTPTRETTVASESTLTTSESDVVKENACDSTVRNRRSVILVSEEDPKVPEFMKIQLNRVDSTRPKSHVVLSKNVKEDSLRRQSIEILDTTKIVVEEKKSLVVKAATPVPKTTVKQTAIAEPVHHRTTNALAEVKTVIAERRLSVSDEKAKIERRLSVTEDSKVERPSRKTSEDSGIAPVSRKASSDDENIVVLRKKSSVSSTKEDSTPELMKVFARRSLKLKDTDEMQLYDHFDRGGITKNVKQTGNIDSDKENQSSSEEKLDRFSKGDLNNTIVTNGNGHIKPPSGKTPSFEEKITTTPNGDNYRKSSLQTTAKPFATNSPNRFSANVVQNYRSTATTFHDIRKSLGVTITTPDATNQQSNQSNNNNGINTLGQNVTNNNNNNNVTTNGRHATVAPLPQQPMTDNNVNTTDDGDICEFKGILQRRAEWEKRAKDACK
ncbi:hypothetical protein DMENIID0001_119230 [Sergentomyia squamirostris]